MRIKILIFPFCLIVSFIVLTMYAKPEFSLINQNRATVKEKEKTLEEIKQKNGRIEGLIANLNANAEKEGLILRYLPNIKEEELIVNTVFQSVVSSSLYLANLGVTYEKKPFNLSADFQNFQVPGAAVAGMNTGLMAAQPVVPANVDVINAKFSLVGTYENIKSFLNQIYIMEKQNNISSIKVSKGATAEGQQGEGTNVSNLTADVVVYFDNIPSLKLPKGSSHPVFIRNSYDFSVVNDLQNLFNKKVPALEVSASGKSNPFLP